MHTKSLSPKNRFEHIREEVFSPLPSDLRARDRFEENCAGLARLVTLTIHEDPAKKLLGANRFCGATSEEIPADFLCEALQESKTCAFSAAR